MHILDLIMYFVSCFLLWGILHLISGGEFTQEIGAALVGMPIIVLYTIIHIILFVWIDYNWIDIFHSIRDGIINWYSNLKL